MANWKDVDLKEIRREFAQRLEWVIGDKKNPQNLPKFSTMTGRPIPKLISWRNPEDRNWPRVDALIYMCWGADISPAWLLFGRGEKHLSKVPSREQAIEQTVEQLVLLVNEYPDQKDRRKIKHGVYQYAQRIVELLYERAEVEGIPQTAALSEKIDNPVIEDSARVLSIDRKRGRTHRGKPE